MYAWNSISKRGPFRSSDSSSKIPKNNNTNNYNSSAKKQQQNEKTRNPHETATLKVSTNGSIVLKPGVGQGLFNQCYVMVQTRVTREISSIFGRIFFKNAIKFKTADNKFS